MSVQSQISLLSLARKNKYNMPTVAVVGTGFIGPVHVEALHRLGISVRGVLGSSFQKSQQAAQQMSLEVAYPDYQAIIDDPLVDAVHITTPNKTHIEMAKRALLAGKHVVCEKPLAMTSRETAELVELSRSKPNLITAVNYNIRFYPIVLHARDLVKSGKLGDIFSVRGAYSQDWLLYDTDWNWRLMPEEGGDVRAVGDIGTHWLDLTGFITGLRVESLLADMATFIPVRKKPRQAVATFTGKETAAPTEYDNVEIRTEDWASVLLRYGGGACGSMSVSQVTAGRKNQLTFEISGSKGAIAWDSERPNELWLGHRERPNELLIKDPSLLSADARAYTNYPGGHNEGFPDTFKQLYRAIYGYLQAGNFDQPKPFPTFEDGHYEVVLCEAIMSSHQYRRWIDIR
jgi:predicted dehydrogenase